MLTQLIEKVIPKKVTVEEIHAEFDSGEQRILNECDKLLSELKIPTETQIERKASIMKELGFINSETVKQAESLKENSNKIKQKIDITAKQAETIRYFKNKYLFEKFITVDELDRICNKYNLIHAPVKNYIKDIPEKNVLEMTNCKKLDENDKLKQTYIIVSFEYWSGASSEYKNWINSYVINKEFTIDISDSERIFEKYIGCNFKGERGSQYWFKSIKMEKIDKSGLFIAAPKSHFNLNGLDKKSKFGFFKVETFEVKDPVVFEYCKDNIVRIVSKWGTADDKSYLDPVLQNEILN